MGTPAGFKQLWDVMRSLPNFPCCSFAGSNYIAQPTSQEARHRAAVHNVSCLVDDQACLHAALQSGKVDFMLDVNASFVLNMHVIRNYPERLARIANRIAYLRTASVPCVLHFNGAGKPKLPTIVAQTRAVWVADYSQQEPASSGKWGPNLTIRDLRDDEY